jgi:hypothetical protein
MGTEYGTIGVAIVSTVILAFGFWVIKKITEM